MFKKLNKEGLKRLETTKLINYNNNLGNNLASMRSGKNTRSHVLKGIIELDIFFSGFCVKNVCISLPILDFTRRWRRKKGLVEVHRNKKKEIIETKKTRLIKHNYDFNSLY